jgi:hypothetical protein
MNQKSIEIMKAKVNSASLSNVSCVAGLIEEYAHPYDVALALHACGNATVCTHMHALGCAPARTCSHTDAE